MSERGENLAQASFPEMEEAKAALHGLEGLDFLPYWKTVYHWNTVSRLFQLGPGLFGLVRSAAPSALA